MKVDFTRSPLHIYSAVSALTTVALFLIYDLYWSIMDSPCTTARKRFDSQRPAGGLCVCTLCTSKCVFLKRRVRVWGFRQKWREKKKKLIFSRRCLMDVVPNVAFTAYSRRARPCGWHQINWLDKFICGLVLLLVLVRHLISETAATVVMALVKCIKRTHKSPWQ